MGVVSWGGGWGRGVRDGGLNAEALQISVFAGTHSLYTHSRAPLGNFHRLFLSCASAAAGVNYEFREVYGKFD